MGRVEHYKSLYFARGNIMYLDHEGDGSQVKQSSHTNNDREREEEIGAGHVRTYKANGPKARVHNLLFDYDRDNKAQGQHERDDHPPREGVLNE